MKRIPLAAAMLLTLLAPTRAFADITAFLGVNPTPFTRPVKGFAVGIGLLVVGFEFEYADTSDELADDPVAEGAAPRLRTYMGNGLVQTPFPIAGMQFYATAGGGVYQEEFVNQSETHFGINVGGGAKVNLIGPLRLRLDYRVFTLKGSATHDRPQRFYAGLNLKF
jgi:opacity protein-like surface antigen